MQGSKFLNKQLTESYRCPSMMQRHFSFALCASVHTDVQDVQVCFLSLRRKGGFSGLTEIVCGFSYSMIFR